MRLKLLGMFFLLQPFSLAAQREPRFTARTNLVPVPTLVLDVNRDAVYGLHSQDFIIEDNGVAQTVHLDEAAESEPLSIMIAVQRGRRANREFEKINGLASMLNPVLSNGDNEAAVLLFDSKLDLVHDFTSNAEEIEAPLRNLDSGDSGAAILDAVAYSARLLARREEGRQLVLLLISETRDHGSKFTKLNDVVRLIGANNISVFAVPFSPYLSKQLDTLHGRNQEEWGPGIDLREKLIDLREALRKNIPGALVSMTGAEYEFFATRNGFENDLTTFANHLHSRYQLSFEPNDPQPGFHSIRVKLRNPGKGWTVLSRNSYWVDDSK